MGRIQLPGDGISRKTGTSRRCARMGKLVGSAAVVLLGLGLLQRLLMPKYASDVVEGALIAEYYSEEKDHDVIFIGDCEVYENFSPAVLWRDYGINSYIRGSATRIRRISFSRHSAAIFSRYSQALSPKL